MVSSLLKIGIESLDRLASAKSNRAGSLVVQNPLSAYPRLHGLLAEAERSGRMAAERRRLMERRYRA